MKKKRTFIITIVCIFLIAVLTVPALAWFAKIFNAVDPSIRKGYVIQQYFHCGSGTEEDPFVITRPIHYYHLAELYLRNPTVGTDGSGNDIKFADQNYHFQLGYNLDNDDSNGLEVYAYDSLGYTDGSTSKTLNMAYYSGNLSLIPVGTSDYPFDGVFDGSGLTISNLSVYSAEYVNGVLTGSNDIGIFGCVKNTDNQTVIKNTYFENVTISLYQANCIFGAIADNATVHSEGNVCIGTLIGHLYNYTNATGRDYTQNTVVTNASPIYDVYLNNVTVTGGAVSEVICDYGLIGHVENSDDVKAQSIRKYIETDELYSSGNESWGGSIDMTELFNRVTAQITSSESSYNRYYPTAETIIQSGTSSGTPSVTMTEKSGETLRSDYGSVYYWSAARLAGLNVSSDMTGGAIYGTDSGNEWNYLYGLKSSQLTTTTSLTKTGDTVTAYYIFNNSYYMAFSSGTATGVKSAKDAVKLIPKNAVTANGETSAKYYILVDSTEYYLQANGTSGVRFVTEESNGTTWISATGGEFYTVIGGQNYYLAYDGAWSLSQSATRYAITDGTHYLAGTIDGVETTSESSRGYIWIANKNETTNTYSFYFVSSGTRYYLYVKNGELAICENGGISYTWNYVSSGSQGAVTLSTTVNGVVYYLCYDNGWRATINGVTISNNEGKYLKMTTDGASTATSSNATVFQLQTTGEGTKIIVPLNGVAYYLTCVGETLQLTTDETVWTRTADNRFYRNTAYTGDAAILTNDYYICYQNGWKVAPASGYYFAYKSSSTGYHYMSMDSDNNIVDSTNEADAVIWQYPIAALTSAQISAGKTDATSTGKVATLIGEDAYYLQVNDNGLLVSDSATAPVNWTIVTSYKSDYTTVDHTRVRFSSNYKTSDYFYVAYFYRRLLTGDTWEILDNGTWGLYCVTTGSNATYPATVNLIRDTSGSHYLTFNPKTKTVTGSVTTYLAVDGNWDTACNWIIKSVNETDSGTGLPKVAIYTYLGQTRYFLNVIDGTLCISSTAATWLKTENLGGSGNPGFSKEGYYLSFEDPQWTLIDLTASVKLNYNDSTTDTDHYLFTNGTGVGVITEASLANNWVFSSVTNDLSTNIGSTKYYLSYTVETVKVKAGGEANEVLSAYRKIVPTVTTVNPSIVWANDGSYYFTLNGVRFYLYWDEASYSWQYEEVGGYQIKQGSSYLTLKENTNDLSASPIIFTVGSLCRSATPNYQWHIINNQIFTFLGDTPYYLNYTGSNEKAQHVTVSTSAGTGTFTKTGADLTQVLSYVAMKLSYIDDDVTLPAEYTRIEYLQSTGNQIIDTGVADARNITIDCDIEAPLGRSQYLFGSSQNGGMMFNGLYSKSGYMVLEYAFQDGPTIASNRIQMTQTLSGSNVTITYNGTAMGTYSVGSANPTGNIYIYGCNKGGRMFGSGMKVYRFTIKRDNVVIRDFIPAVNSSGVTGLYDVIEGKFYYNEFVGGGNSASVDPSIASTVALNGFTAVEYVQSTGKQIINTGVADAKNITIDCDVEAPFGVSNYLFGSSQNGGMMFNGLYSQSGNFILEYAFQNGPTVTSNRVRMTQTLSSGNVTVTYNDTTMGTYSVGSTNPNGNIYVFGAAYANGNIRPFGAGMKVYRFTIKKGDEIVRDFVPVMRNSDGVYGLYDLVKNKFYENANSDADNFASGDTPFYMIPDNGYSSISYGNTYMKLNSDLSIGSTAKNSANRYEYQQFRITPVSGGYRIELGNSGYYLANRGSLGEGSGYSEKGTLTKTADTSKALWVKEGDKYYQLVGTEKYYLIYTAENGWFSSPSLTQLSFRYILSNGNYMAVNSSMNGITSTTAYSTTNEYLRWFVDNSNKVYAEIGGTKYYLTWSATDGFGITTTSNSGTAFTVTTVNSTTGTASLAIKDSSPGLYVVNDDSGWNISVSGGNYIYSGSSYINATSASALGIQPSGKTRWVTSSNKIYGYYAGKIVYWTTTNGSTVTLTNSSSSATSWTVSSGKYSTVYNGITYSLYLNGSSLTLTGPKGYFIYAIILPTYNNGPDHSYMYHDSNTATSPKNMMTASMTEALGGLWTFSNNLIYFTYTSGSTTNTRYLTYNSTTAPASSGSGSSFNIGSSTSNVTWSYDATTHRLRMTKTTSSGSITGYVALRISGNSVQGWKLYSTDTVDPITKSDNRTTGNYFDVYMDPVYDTSKVTTFTSSTQSAVDDVLKSDTYTSGMTPQDLSSEHSTEASYEFSATATAIPSAVPASEIQSARTTTNLVTYTAKTGKRDFSKSLCFKTFIKEALTVTQYTSVPVAVTVPLTQANPTVSMIVTSDRLYVTTTTTYKRGTYLPIKSSFTDDAETSYTSDYHAGVRNTGYIVGGSYSSRSGSGQGDIRISEYSSSNISNSYNRNYGAFTNIYTFNDAGGTSPVLINESANNYINYSYTKEKFLEILSQNRSYVYGLHFMDSAISTDNIMTAESVRVLGKTYINYELPESSIDFNVFEQGQIILYAGDYYTSGNSCFFSLHKVFRNDDTTISSIKEISEIYTKVGGDIKKYEYYIYKFTDGTYTNSRGEYVNEQLTSAILSAAGYETTPVFKMSWLTNPTNGKNFSNDYIYYFEIPCNPGEYALGSVEGQDGGYLLYLDIATNGIHGTTYNQRAGIFDDPLLTQIGYRSSDDDLVINSLLNIAYKVPTGNTAENFRITISYDADDIVHDEKYGPSGIGLDCSLFTINITNTTGQMMDLYVLLLDNDDDPANDYPYRYRIIYNGMEYVDSTAYDPEIGACYATSSFSLPKYSP